jgi:2-keto-3-deoxy-L-rhamnonate aldolase RhmA
MLKNRIKAAAAEKRTAFGCYITQPAPALVEIAAQAGLDFVRIDTYHGTMSIETIDGLIRAAYANGITATARVQNHPFAILQLLQIGLMGVNVPDVEDAEMAKRVVQACRYPPKGTREISRPTGTMGVASEDYFRWADEELIVSVQIESRRGLDNLEEILAVDGLDMVQSGRSDLALSLGVPGQANHPIVLEAEEKIIAAAEKAGKMVSIHFQPGPGALERLGAYSKRGVQALTIGNDTQIFYQGLRERVAAIRG